MKSIASNKYGALFLSLLVLLLVGYAVLMFLRDPSSNPLPVAINNLPDSSDSNPVRTKEIVIFFSKTKGQENITEGVVRVLPYNKRHQAIAYAVEQLLTGPNESESMQGYFSEIPKGTRLIEVVRRGNVFRVNLSRQFVSGGGSNSMQQRLGELKETIRSVERRQPVYVDIEGQELQVLGGEGVVVQEPVNQGNTDPR